MTEEITDIAFWTCVNAIDEAEAKDQPLDGAIPQLLHYIFEADQQQLLIRNQQSQTTHNITCMQPDDGTGEEGAARKMNYIFDDGDAKNLPLMEGRKCEGGTCCDQCSRNIYPQFCGGNGSNSGSKNWFTNTQNDDKNADEKENDNDQLAQSDIDIFPELSSFTFNDLETCSAKTILQFVRLIERVRRTIAYEYGLPLATILPLQAYSRKYVAGAVQQGGGGGEGDFVIMHTDEATHDGYHYSCVIYLSTAGEDFEGGEFVFNDPDPNAAKDAALKKEQEEDEDDIQSDFEKKMLAALLAGEPMPEPEPMEEHDQQEEMKSAVELEEEIRTAGRILTPFRPNRGSAVIFSSGWENMHEVSKITAGTRYAIPCFFTTCPVQAGHYDQMNVGKPKTNEDIADDWLHLLLAHRKEEPMQSVGRVKELLMKWHYMCTPLSQHNTVPNTPTTTP